MHIVMLTCTHIGMYPDVDVNPSDVYLDVVGNPHVDMYPNVDVNLDFNKYLKLTDSMLMFT